MRIKNLNELEEASKSEEFARLFIMPGEEKIIMDSLRQNVELLVDAYGEDGSGGYISVIPHSISTEEGASEYLSELAAFNVQPDMWEFDDVLAQSDTEQVRMQLFAMTECNLLLLYIKKGE